MREQMELTAQRREVSSKGELRRLRRSGRIPGVVYGKNVAGGSAAIAVDERELLALLRKSPNGILKMDVAGLGKFSVLAAELQQDPMSRNIIHADFHQISMDEKIKAPVRLEVEGKSAGEMEGGLLQLVLYELEVECLPKDLPDAVMVPIQHLQIGDSLTVGELQLPPGVETAQDPDTVVVTILAPQKESAEEPEAQAAETTVEEQPQA